MIEANVLITSASRKVNLIKTFKKFINENGILVATDINYLSAALYFADAFEIVPKTEDINYFHKIIEICKDYNINLIIPTRDEELPFFSSNKKKLKNFGILTMVADEETIKICQNKELFHDFCHLNNISTPKRYNIEDKKIDFPVFIKPIHGKASRNTFKANSLQELIKIQSSINQGIVIEEYINCPEFTIDYFADFDGKAISIIPRKRLKIVSGESYITRTVKDEDIIQESLKLANKLKLIGHNTIQCFKCKNGDIKFIEVNPRYGGAAHLSFKAGAPTPLFLIQLLRGEKLKSRIGEFKTDLVMLRFTEDIFLDEVGKLWN